MLFFIVLIIRYLKGTWHSRKIYETRISNAFYGPRFLLIPSQECCMAIPLSQIVFIEEQAAGIGKR